MHGADVRRMVSLSETIRVGQFWSRFVMSKVEVEADEGTARAISARTVESREGLATRCDRSQKVSLYVFAFILCSD